MLLAPFFQYARYAKINPELGSWGAGAMGSWGAGEMGRWGVGELGRWGDG
ncbi:MAG: hypothetical protein F6K52_34030, partial [Moorea sp. SIO3H5]|nr:hypothetical protein [Moorena sp. SIO3H5]